MTLKVFLASPPKGRDVIKVYRRLFSTSHKILKALDIRVQDVLKARLILVKKADLGKEVLPVTAIEVGVSRVFRIIKYPDLSQFSVKFSEGYIRTIARHNDIEFICTVWAEAGMPDEIRDMDGDIRITVHDEERGIDNITDIIPEEVISEKLDSLPNVLSWEVVY